MTYRLAVLGLGHETNTFSGIVAELSAYEDGGIHRGQELVDHYLTSQATYAGFLADAPNDVELVPLLAAWINPCGPITADAFDAIVGEMESSLRSEGPFDGVLLSLHGAAVAEGHPDADADIAERVRSAIGADVPIAVVIDMHANVSATLAALVDILLAYQTNPHVDPRVRGGRARDLLLDALRSAHLPGLALEMLPLVVTITKQDTGEQPMRSLLDQASALMERDGVLDVSIVEGFPYADVPQMGMSIIAVHRDGEAAARAVAQEMGALVWAQREELQGGGTALAEVMDMIATHTDPRPLLILDVGDNVGGGGPGDSTVLFHAAQKRGLGRIVGVINDPKAVAELAQHPLGSRVSVDIGGRTAEQDGEPLHVAATVIARSDGRYEEPQVAHGGLRFFDAGAMVALACDGGLDVTLTSKLVQPITPHQLRAVGLDPSAYRAIFAKGVNGPRAGYEGIYSAVVVADTPGVTRVSVEGLPYEHRRTPMFPFEPQTTYL